MMIAPVIFCTVVHGIASMSDLAKVGWGRPQGAGLLRVGINRGSRSSVCLCGEIVHPGSGFNIDATTLDPKAVVGYVARAKEEGGGAHLLAIIPATPVDAFAKGDLLQVLLIAILTGFAPAGRMGGVGKRGGQCD